MGFPEQERFTAEDVARLWEKSPAYVDELIRTLQFTHIIVVGELIDGSPLTRHLYFDRALWIENYGKKLQTDPGIRRKELEGKIERYRKEWKKKGLEFDSSTMRKTYAEDIGPTSYNIGQDEVANFWNPSPPRNEWKQPKEPVQVYIPRSAVLAFEEKYDIQRDTAGQKERDIESEQILDLSRVAPDKLYPLHVAARFIGLDLKYLRNNIRRFPAEKVGGRWYFKGQFLLEFRKKSPTKY